MIKVQLKIEIKGKNFAKGFYMPNLGNHPEIVYKQFKQLFRCAIYQILIEINEKNTIEADKESRRKMHQYFKGDT